MTDTVSSSTIWSRQPQLIVGKHMGKVFLSLGFTVLLSLSVMCSYLIIRWPLSFRQDVLDLSLRPDISWATALTWDKTHFLSLWQCFLVPGSDFLIQVWLPGLWSLQASSWTESFKLLTQDLQACESGPVRPLFSTTTEGAPALARLWAKQRKRLQL